MVTPAPSVAAQAPVADHGQTQGLTEGQNQDHDQSQGTNPLFRIQFNPDVDYNAKITIRSGPKNGSARGGKSREYSFRISEGFETLKGKFCLFLNSNQFDNPAVLEDETVFFKNANSCTQSNFVAVNELNFESQMSRKWSYITAHQFSDWREANVEPAQAHIFEFFMYIQRPQSNGGRRQIHRATENRIQESTCQLQENQRTTGESFGAITMNHLSIVNARILGKNF